MLPDPTPLRPHHALCMAFFQGRGYSPAFTRHMEETLAALLGAGEHRICLTTVGDEVCAFCPYDHAGRCEHGEKVGEYDRRVLHLCGLRAGQVLPFRELVQRVQGEILAQNRRGEVCGGCRWESLCAQGHSRWEN